MMVTTFKLEPEASEILPIPIPHPPISLLTEIVPSRPALRQKAGQAPVNLINRETMPLLFLIPHLNRLSSRIETEKKRQQ